MSEIAEFKKQNRIEHDIIFSKIDEIREAQGSISEDIAVIKSYLVGNGREGIIKKVERHEKFWNMAAGGSVLIGFTFAAVKAFGG